MAGLIHQGQVQLNLMGVSHSILNSLDFQQAKVHLQELQFMLKLLELVSTMHTLLVQEVQISANHQQ
jgi:hypothetical protein